MYKSLLLTAGLSAVIATGSLEAMPLDNFLSAHSGLQGDHRIQLEVSRDFATDEVAFSPNTDDGAHLPPRDRKRYLGQHLLLRASISPNLTLDAGLWERQLTSLRDSYALDTFHTALQFRLPFTLDAIHFAVRAGVWRNSADTLHKNSYTRRDGYLFTSASVEQPSDLQTQINMIGSRMLSSGLEGSLFAGLGRSRVDFDSLSAIFRSDQDCRYRFDYEPGRAEVSQLDRCGSFIRFHMVLPNEDVIEDELGVSPRNELSYKSSYWQLGGSLKWQKSGWMTRVGYYYQRFDRGALDDLIRSRGDTPSTTIHNLQTDVSYHFSKRLGVFFRSEYMSNRLIDMVPFTYNAYTASKFGKSGLLFNSGLIVSF